MRTNLLQHTNPCGCPSFTYLGLICSLISATLQLSAFDLEILEGVDARPRSKLLLSKECKSHTPGLRCSMACQNLTLLGISLLRQRVEDPILGISDETIGSVLVLTIVEVDFSSNTLGCCT